MVQFCPVAVVYVVGPVGACAAFAAGEPVGTS
jgi:hypothetical protein